MKRPLFITLIFFICPLVCFGQRHLHPLQNHFLVWFQSEDLAGVSNIRYNEYQYSSGLCKNKELYLETTSQLDSLGRLTHSVAKGKYYTNPQRIVWAYDESGCPMIEGDSSSKNVGKIVFKCSNGGLVDTIFNWYTMQAFSYEYNSSKITLEKVYHLDSTGKTGPFLAETKFEYDGEGYLSAIKSSKLTMSFIRNGNRLLGITTTEKSQSVSFEIEYSRKHLPSRITEFRVKGRRRIKVSEGIYSYD